MFSQQDGSQGGQPILLSKVGLMEQVAGFFVADGGGGVFHRFVIGNISTLDPSHPLRQTI